MKKITGLMAMLAVAGALAAPVVAADRDNHGRDRDDARRTVAYGHDTYTARRDLRARRDVRPVHRDRHDWR